MDFSFVSDTPTVRAARNASEQQQAAAPPATTRSDVTFSQPSTLPAPVVNTRSYDTPNSSYPGTTQVFGCQRQGLGVDPNCIIVSKRQEGNPVLKHIKRVRWAFGDIVPDYILGANTCALFLSLRFHLLKPEYIHQRIRELQRSFRLRVLLCYVDVDDVVEPLAQVIKAALLNDCTLICGWSPEECARYLETYKSYENKPPDAIQGRAGEDYLSKLNAVLTTIRSVNRTDVATLGATFRTAAGIMNASFEELSACPGIGPTKVRRLYDTFHEPFRKTLSAAAPARQPAAAGQPAAGNPLSDGRRSSGSGGNIVGGADGAAPDVWAAVGGEILLLDERDAESDEETAAYDMLD